MNLVLCIDLNVKTDNLSQRVRRSGYEILLCRSKTTHKDYYDRMSFSNKERVRTCEPV